MDGHTVGEVPRAEEFDWEDPFFEGFVLPKTGVSIDHLWAREKYVL